MSGRAVTLAFNIRCRYINSNLPHQVIKYLRGFHHLSSSQLYRPYSSSTKMAANDDKWKQAETIYEFGAEDIDGNNVSLEKYRGKVCIIVNVACKCGLTTSNYTQLQELYDKYAEKGLSILAFPSNEFAGQEPGSNEDIKKYVTDTFGVRFDLFSKIEVNGKNAHPLFKFLKKEQKGTLGDFIKWNFSKFLVNREGKPCERYAPNTEPQSFQKDIEKVL